MAFSACKADAILVPSRFEPCGLTQLIGLRYGTLPVVARVGTGLADTVIDANEAAVADGVATGFHRAVTADALAEALSRAMGLFASRATWRRLVRRAMTREVSPNAARRWRAEGDGEPWLSRLRPAPFQQIPSRRQRVGGELGEGAHAGGAAQVLVGQHQSSVASSGPGGQMRRRPSDVSPRVARG